MPGIGWRARMPRQGLFHSKHPSRLPSAPPIMKIGSGGVRKSGNHWRREPVLEAMRSRHSRGPAPLDSGSSPERRGEGQQPNRAIFVPMIGGKMLALRYHGNKDLRLEDIPDPSPGPGEVRVRCRYTSICATDIEEWQYGPMWVQYGSPNPLFRQVCAPGDGA